MGLIYHVEYKQAYAQFFLQSIHKKYSIHENPVSLASEFM